MLRIYSTQAEVGIHEQIEFEKIVALLKTKGYDTIIRNMINESYQTVKLSAPTQKTLASIMERSASRSRRDDYSGGEIFVKDDSLFAVFPSYSITTVSLIGFEQEFTSLKNFCDDFQKSVELAFDGRRIRGTRFNWKAVSSIHRTELDYRYEIDSTNYLFETSGGETQKFEKPIYSVEELTASKILCDLTLRSFLINVSKYGKMDKKDAKNELDDENQIIKLIENGLLSKEFMVKCVQDHRTICTVPDLETLQSETNSNTRCPTCRRKLSEETVQEVYTVSEMGRKLLGGSKWMSIWVTEELFKHGIQKNSIDWGIEDNGEEIDIRISDFNSKALLELKDREFGGGDTHPFSYRVEKYRGKIGGILTTRKIAKEAKKILDEQKSKVNYRLVTLEGIDEIERGLKKLVREMSLLQIINQLRSLTGAYPSIFNLVHTWAINKIISPPSLGQASTIDKSQTDINQLKNKPPLEN